MSKRVCLYELIKKLSATSVNQDQINNVHHEHIGAANKSDVLPNTPPADEADL
jgi:hypothetical protein